MSKRVKSMLISDIRRRLGDTRDLLVVDTAGLDAVTANELRRKMQEKNIQALTVKNTLARVALREVGVDALDSCLAGPSTLVWGSDDIVALSKEITKWAKDIAKFEIKGGAVEGTPVDAAGVESLSKSPSREELIAGLVGQILSPGANLAAALLGPGSTLASQLKTMTEEEGEQPAEEAA